MKQTNYHLFDFMDFDPELKAKESLWKCWQVTAIKERHGDIELTIPFQKQKQQEDMEPDMDAPQESYTVVLRAYQPNMLRLFVTMIGDPMTERDEMLQMADDVKTVPLSIENNNGNYLIKDPDGRLRASIDTKPYELDHWSDLLPPTQPTTFLKLYPDGDIDKPIELSDDHFSPPRYDALPIGFVQKDGHPERATLAFKCEPDECFVGTGERFRKMDLSGQTFQLKNQDGQGVNNRRCYKNIPFYLSSREYGVFYHTSDYCKLSLADQSTRSVQFVCDRATLDIFLIGGRNPEEILHSYRRLTGYPTLPPLWSYGIWMSRMSYFSAEEVNAICRRLREEHYPCDVIHLDTGWFRTDWLCEWKFNPDRFPDPEGFIRNLKQHGFRVSLWQLPYIAEGAEQLKEAKENKYISQPKTPKQQEAAGGQSNFSALDYAGTIDFTYDRATEWYKGLLKKLLEMGVSCIKTDFGENIHMDHIYHGMAPEQLNNIYGLLYQRAAFEITQQVNGLQEGIVWARSAWAGCQRYPLHWGGDSQSSWDGMAGSLKGGLHFGLSGFSFWSHDVPGFHSTPDFMNSPVREDVYVRWTQFGVFTSHMRYHGTCKREPWSYPRIAPIVKRWWKLRYRLLPYIYEQARMTTETGYPMVQALIFHHPEDKVCWHIDDEYYFGNQFLVCPIMNSKHHRDIYLPEGKWINFFTGESYEGGKWLYDYACPLELMPVFVHPDAEIACYPEDVDSTDEMDMRKTVTLKIDHNFKRYKI